MYIRGVERGNPGQEVFGTLFGRFTAPLLKRTCSSVSVYYIHFTLYMQPLWVFWLVWSLQFLQLQQLMEDEHTRALIFFFFFCLCLFFSTPDEIRSRKDIRWRVFFFFIVDCYHRAQEESVKAFLLSAKLECNIYYLHGKYTRESLFLSLP